MISLLVAWPDRITRGLLLTTVIAIASVSILTSTFGSVFDRLLSRRFADTAESELLATEAVSNSPVSLPALKLTAADWLARGDLAEPVATFASGEAG